MTVPPPSSSSLVDQLADYALKRDLPAFHQWLFSIKSDDGDSKDLDFDDADFRRSYAEKIFSLGATGQLTSVWRLFLEHFSADNQPRVALFGAFLAHARILDGRLQTATTLLTLEQLLLQTSDLIADFSPLKEAHLLSLYYRLLGLMTLLAQSTCLPEKLSKASKSLFDLSDVFEATKASQWRQLYGAFERLPSEQQLSYVLLMITKHRYLKAAAVPKNSTAVELEGNSSKCLEELMAKLVEGRNKDLVRVDVFTSLLPCLGHRSMLAALEYLLELFTSSPDDQPLCQQVEAILADGGLWEQGGLPFQAAYITALVRAVAREMATSQTGRSGRKRKSPEADEPGSSEGQSSSLVVLQILASKEKLWPLESRTTLTCTEETSSSLATKEAKIPALLRSASEALLALIQDDQSSSSSQAKSSSKVNNNNNSLIRLLNLLLATAPLEHLTPVSQLRTILLLSAVLISSSSEFSSEFSSVESSRQQLASAFVTANRRIWASVRSVWLFDFVPPAEYILAVLVGLLRCYSSSEFSSESTSNSTATGHLDSACYSLFSDCLIPAVFQLYDLPRSGRNAAALAQVLNAGDQSFGSGGQKVANLEYFLVMLQTMLLRANGAFLRKLGNGRFFEGGGGGTGHRETFEALGREVGTALYRNIKIYLEDTTASSLERSEFVVEGLTRLFEYKVFAEMDEAFSGREEGEEKGSGKLKSKWRKLLTRFIALSLENIGGEVSEVEGGQSNQQQRQEHFVHFLRVVLLNRGRLHGGYSLPGDFVARLWAKVTGEESCLAQAVQDENEDEDEPPAEADPLTSKLASETAWRRLFKSRKSLGKFRRLLEHQPSDSLLLGRQLAAYDRRLATFAPLFGPLAAATSAHEWATILLPSAARMLSGVELQQGGGSSASSALARSLFAIRVLLELLGGGGENSHDQTEKSTAIKELEAADKSRLLANHYCHLLLTGLLTVNLVAGKWCTPSDPSNSNSSGLLLAIIGRARTDSVTLARRLLFRLTSAGLLSNAHLFLALNLAAECSPLSLLPPPPNHASSSSLIPSSTFLSPSDPALLPTFTRLFAAHNALLQELTSRRPALLLYSMGGGSHGSLLVGLLTSLMRAAHEGGVESLMGGGNSTDAQKLALEQCSAGFAHNIASLCQWKLEFSAFGEHLLAAYLSLAPAHSVAPPVRKHLEAVAFSLIDLLQQQVGRGGDASKAKKTSSTSSSQSSSSSSLERLYSAVGRAGPRELLGRLLEQYDKYHRFKGYV